MVYMNLIYKNAWKTHKRYSYSGQILWRCSKFNNHRIMKKMAWYSRGCSKNVDDVCYKLYDFFKPVCKSPFHYGNILRFGYCPSMPTIKGVRLLKTHFHFRCRTKSNVFLYYPIQFQQNACFGDFTVTF